MGELQCIDVPPAPPPRPENAHKGVFGTVIVVGGNAEMMGAPALCAAAALRGGAGLVRIASSARVIATALTVEPAAVGITLGGQCDGDLDLIGRADPQEQAVLAVGPGLGTSRECGELVHALLAGRRRVVLDADGLNLLAQTGSPRHGRSPLILTPHPGEFARLAAPLGIRDSATHPDERPRAAARLAQAHRAVVLLKGRQTIVTDGQSLYVNRTGNAALATAGSGDVLTGLIASLLAQGMNEMDAAMLGAHLHGLAADRWAARFGPSGLTAMDLVRLIPQAMHAWRRRGESPDQNGPAI